MNFATSYAFLTLAVLLGVTSNSFAKSSEGFTLLIPSIITAITNAVPGSGEIVITDKNFEILGTIETD